MARDILIVDDERDIRSLIAGILNDEGYQTRTAANDEEALAAMAQRVPSMIILDIWLQDSRLDGLGLLEEFHKNHPNVPVVMISGHGNVETAVQAIKIGAYDYIEKPFKSDRLLLIVQRAMEAARLARENRELRQRAGPETEIIGKSPAVANLRSVIEKVASTGSRVLINGPAGAGKEVVARNIHANSSRGQGPFIVLNAAMMAPERVEEELFGVDAADGEERRRRIGVFEQAHGGTLFLDEVGDMPLETQGKVLRVLVDQTFQRVGGTHRVEVDVRLICSSTRNLENLIVDGHFREDLYHRLNVVPVSVPALKQRPEDIPLLVDYFLGRSSETLGLAPRELTQDAMAALQVHDWPGNVRQLRNVVERLVIMATDQEGPIGVDMLPAEIGAPTPSTMRGDDANEVMGLSLREAREVFEREYLVAQISRFGGNISRTAEFVGMERSALHRKLKSLGVSARPVGG
jgi:two-component system nitrogen regulation response regulator NtrX